MNETVDQKLKQLLSSTFRSRAWLVLLLCLSLIVGIGTVSMVKYTAIAKTKDGRVLACPYQTPDREGYAHYPVHVHDEDCYDAETGELVCPLPEIPPHEHTDACYNENGALICGRQELHTHSDACYDQDGKLICVESWSS